MRRVGTNNSYPFLIMKNEEILKRAIEKARKNGYGKLTDFSQHDYSYWSSFTRYYGTIFKHSFAKAFWGIKWDSDSLAKQTCNDKYKAPWRYHLQQMVLEKEPLKYLEKYL